MLSLGRFRLYIVALFMAVSLASSESSAQTLIKHGESGNMALLPLTACAAPVAQRTLEMPDRTPKGYGLALFHVKLTAATTFDLQCFSSINRDFVFPETHGKLQICDTVVTGVCKLIDAKFTKTTAAAEELIARIDFLGSEDVQCIISCTAGSFQLWGRMSAL